ncbi:M50 family metallopeptidase [Leifsonia poae]|uniref:M50 family metallopeptidase n=1 Tax=Leifsonia poae TaxID=110933 RepID=UPI003D664BC9
MQSMAQDARVASMETVAVGEDERTFYKLPVWKRIIIMFGGPFMNLLIGVVLFGVLLMGFGTPQASTTVGSVSQCVLPSTSARQTCESGDPAGPAAGAGIKPGDKIISIDGTTITSWSQSTSIIRTSADRTLSIVIERDGVKKTVAVTPKTNTVAKTDSNGVVLKDASGAVQTQSVGFLGIGTEQQLVPQPPTAVLPAVGAQVGAVTGVIINLPQRLVDVWNAAFGPGERDPNGPMSIVGVGRVAGEVTALNGVPVVDKVYSILGLLASLNIALFVFNLIPLLPLDGGHIAGALWEGIRRTWAKLFKRRDPGPVDMAKLMPLTMAVVVVLGGMSLLLVYADIVKPVGIG